MFSQDHGDGCGWTSDGGVFSPPPFARHFRIPASRVRVDTAECSPGGTPLKSPDAMAGPAVRIGLHHERFIVSDDDGRIRSVQWPTGAEYSGLAGVSDHAVQVSLQLSLALR